MAEPESRAARLLAEYYELTRAKSWALLSVAAATGSLQADAN